MTRLRSLLTSEKGFSFIEIILTVVLVGFLVYLLSSIPSSIKLIGNSQHNSVAKEIIHKKIENLRLQGYDNLSNGVTELSDPRIASLPSGSATVDIRDCPATICTNNELIKQATVTVAWKDANSTNSAQVQTLIAKYGL
jgi:type II secretory pathway pseudopilin PulG